MRWLAMAFCFAVAAVPAYGAYETFDAISSDNDTAAILFIVWGSILALASVAAVISGVVLFVLWPWRRRSGSATSWR